MNTRSTDALLGCLYDSVMDARGFQDFIEALKGSFGLKAVTMFSRHVETQEIKGLWLSGVEPQWLQSYALEYAGDDVLGHYMLQAPIARFYASNLDLPMDHSTLMAGRFYRDWLEPQGIAYAAGSVVLREGAWLTQLFVQRAPQHPPFVRAELDQLDYLIPHLQRAIQMRQRFAELQLGHNLLADGLDVLAMPTILFDEYGRVMHCNHSATSLLAEGSVLALQNGHLQAADRVASRQLSLELGNAIRASRGEAHDEELAGVVLLPGKQDLPLMLMIAPLRPKRDVRGQGAALLFAFDPNNTPAITADLVRRLFGLTEAESQLAVALCGGKTLNDAAEERGTSIHTTRSQLKSIFQKTGTKRQTDLVSMMLASPAYFLARTPGPAMHDIP